MTALRPKLPVVVGLGVACMLGACQDKSQAPSSRPESPPLESDSPEASLGPVDLIYICGNKFLATNATRSPVHITYRVAGTRETGSLTLREASGEDEGYSETELDTRERGTVELYQDDEPVARRRNQNLPCGASPASLAISSLEGSASLGEWSPSFAWPNIAVHLNLLPNGKVLSWGLSGMPHVWDPAARSFTSVPAPAVIFCAGHSFLEDGRLLVSGGNNHPTESLNGIPDNTIFNPVAQSWTRSTPMRKGRWYPTNTTLANGDVVILAGKDAIGATVREPEVWSSGMLRVLSTAGMSLPLYPRAFLAPNGKVFVAGESPGTRYLDVTGTGSWSFVGNRLYGQRDYGSAVMYDDGKILYVGGGRTTNTAEIIDLNSAAPAWRWTGSMGVPRRHLNATVLPTGEVLVTGGSRGITFNDVKLPVRAAELWNPTTGLWTTLASNAITRVYHSSSILLPDGRILHTGSGDAGPDQRNAELFSPPYLFRGSRPVIGGAPVAVGYATSFTVTTPQAAEIAKVSLIRLGSNTHAFDMNQRFQRLSFALEAGALRVVSPGSRNRTPPGHYMLFILNGNNVPSVARIIRIGGTATPGPGNISPSAAFTSSCTNLSCAFTDGSSDSDGTVTAWSWSFGDGSSSGTQNPSRTFAAPGTYNVTLTITDNSGGTGLRTIPVTVNASSSGIVLSATGRSDATAQYMTLRWTGATGSSVDIYRNGARLRTTANDGSDTNGLTFQGNATYVFRVCQAGTTVCSNEATVTFGGTTNLPPAADFTSSCTGLACAFVDASSDNDGTVSAWNWTFGDGASSAQRSPVHTFAAAGTYSVTLRVSDNLGAEGQRTRPVSAVTGSPSPGIALTATGRSDGTAQYMTLKWSGAAGSMVDVYRNGTRLRTTANDGSDTNGRTFQGPATYVFRVCQAGTSICSNDATVVFN